MEFTKENINELEHKENVFIQVKDGAKIITPDNSKYLDIESHGLIGFSASRIILGKNSTLKLGKYVNFYSNSYIVLKQNTTLEIGDRTYFNDRFTCVVGDKIIIGNDCAFARELTLFDSNVHSINGFYKTKEVVIKDHCWICSNVNIIRGVTIGEGSVIGIGSVVTKSIPPKCLAVGNPAKVIKENITWKF